MQKETQDLIKKSNEEAKRINDEVNERLKKASETILPLLETYKEQHSTLSRELKKQIKQIEECNHKILNLILTEDSSNEFQEKGMIQFQLEGKANENFVKSLQNLNGKYITDKFFLSLPYMIGNIEDIDLQFFKEDFNTLKKISNKKEKLLDEFNQTITSMYQLERNVSELEKEVTRPFEDDDLKNDEDIEKYFSIQKEVAKAMFDEQGLFEITQKVYSEYKISINYDEKAEILTITIEKGFNLDGKMIDISNKKVKELEEQIQKLKQENKELKEDSFKLVDFKSIPIENQISFNDKLSRSLSNIRNEDLTEITNTMTSKRTNSEVLKVLIQNEMIETNEQVIDDFDELVFETIYSLSQKNKYFDIQMIKEQLTQQKDNRHKNELDELIAKAIDKGRTTFFQIEVPENIKKTMKKDFNDRRGVKEPFFYIAESYVVKGGQKKSVYQLRGKSLYFDYVEARGQLITKENEMLQLTGFKKDKKNLLIIKRISDRIKDMQYQKKKNKENHYQDKILFDFLFSGIDFEHDPKGKPIKEESVKKNKSRAKETIESILKQYQKKKIIKSFKTLLDGISIEL